MTIQHTRPHWITRSSDSLNHNEMLLSVYLTFVMNLEFVNLRIHVRQVLY